MNLFKKEYKKEKSIMGFKSPQKVIESSNYQTGKTIKSIDKKRTALPSGKRMSKTGKVYYETRANRSDLSGTNL